MRVRLMHRIQVSLRLVAVAFLGCSREVSQDGLTAPSGWFEIARTQFIAAYLDTSRVERLPGDVRRVWFRFVFTEPMSFAPDTAARYRAFESRQEMDCQQQRTRDLELKLETVDSVTAASTTPDGAWKPFADHPWNSPVFLVACRSTGNPANSGA